MRHQQQVTEETRQGKAISEAKAVVRGLGLVLRIECPNKSRRLYCFILEGWS
jgi:hypothetical protein